MHSIIYRNILLPAFIFIIGCQPYLHFEYRIDEQVHYIKDVPFFPQEENYCGPAALAGVMGFWGYKISQEDAAKETYTSHIKGAITVDMANYAKRRGFETFQYGGGLSKLKEEIDKGHPLILFLHMGNSLAPQRHYIVVIGYDETKQAVIANSGKGKEVLIPYKTLLKQWERTGFWTLLILPKG